MLSEIIAAFLLVLSLPVLADGMGPCLQLARSTPPSLTQLTTAESVKDSVPGLPVCEPEPRLAQACLGYWSVEVPLF